MKFLNALLLSLLLLPPAWSAPVVETNATTSFASGTVSHTINLPSGIVSGDLLVLLGKTESSTRKFNRPVGWSEIITHNGNSGTSQAMYKFADGTEGATISVSTTDSFTNGQTTVYRISGAGTGFDATSTTNGTTSATRASPALTVTEDDSLLLLMIGDNAETQSFTQPAGLTIGPEVDSDSQSHCSAYGTINSGSQGPWDWTVGTTFHNAMQLLSIAISPEGTGPIPNPGNKAVIISGSSDEFIAGIPNNNGFDFDGSLFWLEYTETTTLYCRYGSELSNLVETKTALNGTSNVVNVRNNGKCFSTVYGNVGATRHAWALTSQTTAGRGFVLHRWDLTQSGLANPIEHVASVGDSTRLHNSLIHNYAGDVSELLGASQIDASSASTRENNAALTGDTGLGAVDSAAITFPEHTRILKLTDGYVAIAVDEGHTGEINGNFGHAREWTRPDLATAWGGETTIESDVIAASVNDGDFADQNYATVTSHAGQQDFAQTTDGTIWVLYCDNADLTNGEYGVLKLVKRGNTVASGWELMNNDVIGSSGEAWHVCMGSDGTDLYLIYVKNNAGVRDTAIYYRKYNVGSNTLGTETKLADMQASHTFVRMFTSWRYDHGRLCVAWSEYDGSTYDLLAIAPVFSSDTFGPIADLRGNLRELSGGLQ